LTVESDIAFLADGERLQQLLENLFRNAIDHGGSDVTIRVGALDDASGFYISDNGTGIAEEKRGEVFESGYSTAQDGTGFGLAIVEEIADAHEWSVRVTESAEGGARFEIAGVEPTH
jgi:signal transduction histidine kinase